MKRILQGLLVVVAALAVFVAAKADYYVGSTQRNRARTASLLEQRRKKAG